jgi:hypothetical protein
LVGYILALDMANGLAILALFPKENEKSRKTTTFHNNLIAKPS